MPAYHQSMTHSFNSNRKPTTSLLFLQAFLDVLLDIARTLHQCLTPRVLEIWPAWICLAHCYWRWLTNIDIWLLYFSPNSVWTPRGSHGRCKGRCLIRVLTLVCGILSVNFRTKWLLWNLDVRFDCAGSHKVCGAVLVCGVLPVNFRKKWLLWHVDLHFDCAGSHKVWS